MPSWLPTVADLPPTGALPRLGLCTSVTLPSHRHSTLLFRSHWWVWIVITKKAFGWVLPFHPPFFGINRVKRVDLHCSWGVRLYWPLVWSTITKMWFLGQVVYCIGRIYIKSNDRSWCHWFHNTFTFHFQLSFSESHIGSEFRKPVYNFSQVSELATE